ncbi:MAG TPA: phosphoenolpyruvate--protein phosphotransferase, partial [Gemmatimonadaceae bacterium]|nr:phosphoenolpyruvate--protein phosphotransferase [Gemmatimonadaceae bacterium]
HLVDRALRGIPASPGIAVGEVHLLLWEVPEVAHHIIPDSGIPAEIERLHAALAKAKERVRHVRDRVEASAGKEEAAIFDVQLSILEDSELLRGVEELIRQNLAAEKAFDLEMLEWRNRFARHTNAMLRERVSDLTDVQIRVLAILMQLPDHDPVDLPPGANAILVTHDLTPGLTVQLDRRAIVGIATDAGTRTSHVAILARSLGLPTVVGLKDATKKLKGHERVILDGSSGSLVVNPNDDEIALYRERAAEEEIAETELRRLASLEAVTSDGVPITLRANVDLPEEAEFAATAGAEGVGLMRTEFLVVGRATMPDENEQYMAYRRVVEAFGGKPVVIRTFDVGGDKLPIGGFPTESNPYLGWRAIRMCLDQPVLFKTQLRALLRAADHGDVRIMLPLVVSVTEVRAARALLDEARQELRKRGLKPKNALPLGVMIETPAAAVAADSFVKDVSFFSIGTNDLVQYTLAVDRGNANLAQRFTALHPAVLRLIRRTVEVADQSQLTVAVCGEMASQPLMAYALLGLGVREMSVNARAIGLMKRLVRSVSVTGARDAATRAADSHTAEEAEAILRASLHATVGDAHFMRELPSLAK